MYVTFFLLYVLNKDQVTFTIVHEYEYYGECALFIKHADVDDAKHLMCLPVAHKGDKPDGEDKNDSHVKKNT